MLALSSGEVLPQSAEIDPLHWQKGFVHLTAMHTVLLFVKLAAKLLQLEWHSVKTFEICLSVSVN